VELKIQGNEMSRYMRPCFLKYDLGTASAGTATKEIAMTLRTVGI
jgi:hypothetical protein